MADLTTQCWQSLTEPRSQSQHISLCSHYNQSALAYGMNSFDFPELVYNHRQELCVKFSLEGYLEGPQDVFFFGLFVFPNENEGRMWMFLKKLKVELPCDPAIPLLGMYLEKTQIKKIHVP